LAHFRPDVLTVEMGSDPALLGPNGESRPYEWAAFTLPTPTPGLYVPFNPAGEGADGTVWLLRSNLPTQGK
jgi:hypothetical protein